MPVTISVNMHIAFSENRKFVSQIIHFLLQNNENYYLILNMYSMRHASSNHLLLTFTLPLSFLFFSLLGFKPYIIDQRKLENTVQKFKYQSIVF